MATSLSLTDVQGQLQPGDQPAYRIWSQLGDRVMSGREVLGAIARIANLAHTKEGELIDRGAAEALRTLSVENGTLIEGRDAGGTRTFRRAAQFVPSPPFGSREYNRQQQRRNDVMEADRLRLIDEASQSAFENSPVAIQKREDRAFIVQTLREESAGIVREELRGLLAEASNTELDALRERLRAARENTVAA